MPSKKQYNLVSDDAFDTRIPLYNEEAFRHGITFTAKYIGSLDVPRPSSRVEIVAAMRRIRSEFKAKSLKKKKVKIIVSVDGVKVVLWKSKKANQWPWDESKYVIMDHPIYRIFYVSHDSQDLKIFSYIARDGGTNSFRCNVFKSNRKSTAMQIVRTVGQAFEVCHQLNVAKDSRAHRQDEDSEEEEQNNSADPLPNKRDLSNTTDHKISTPLSHSGASTVAKMAPPTSTTVSASTSPQQPPPLAPHSEVLDLPPSLTSDLLPGTPISVYQQVQLLRSHLDQQSQHAQALNAQVQMLKDQLAAETAARLEAQTQNNQLLLQNTQLLEHIRSLIRHVQELEHKSGTPSPLTPSSSHFFTPSTPTIQSATTTPLLPPDLFSHLDTLRISEQPERKADYSSVISQT